MSSIHYKFRSSLDYDTLTFDGPSISLKDLIDAIMLQKKIGKNSDFTLEVTNAQTKEVYQDQALMVPRNTSVVVKRVPVARLAPVTGKIIDMEGKETPDLANANATEDDKISAMMKQSNEQWQPDQYVNTKIRSGEYVCFRCGQKGHFIRNCPTIGDPRMNNQRFQMRGGVTKEYYMMQMKEKERLTSIKPAEVTSTISSYTPVVASDIIGAKTVPKELQCPMCKKLLHDAVVIPCCGTSYCDECIRNCLIDHDFACPSCKTKQSPDDLIPNKSLRQAVENFRNTSHLQSVTTAANSSVGQPVASISNSQNAASTTDTKPAPKIAIKLLKKSDSTTVKPKTEAKSDQPAGEDDTLNTSIGPITEAQLFAEIAKETVNNEQMTPDVASVGAEQPVSNQDQPDANIDAEHPVPSGTEAGRESPQVNEGITSSAAQQTSQPSVIIQQQQQLTAQQLQLQQQRLQLQQQQIAMQQMQVQPVDAHLQQAAAMPNQVLMQQVPNQVVSMTSALNATMSTSQIIASGQQSISQTAVASQAYHQRLIAPGLVNQVAQVVAAPVMVRHIAPGSGLPVATAFHPSAVHSVVPTRLPTAVASHLSRTGSGHIRSRDTLFDPLFDLSSGDMSTTFVPMTEEEFYRAKIKMKDGGKDSFKRRSRSRSRSPRPASRHSHGESSKSRRSRRTGDTHVRSDSSRRRTDKSSRKDNSQEAKTQESRSNSSSRRRRKEQSAKKARDRNEEKAVDVRKKRRPEHDVANRSGSRSYSPAEQEKIRQSRKHKQNGERSTKGQSPNSWSRSPSPARKTKTTKHGRGSTDFTTIEIDSEVDSEEFKTVKLDESRVALKKSKSQRSKRGVKESEAKQNEATSKTEGIKRSKKRKSDERREEKEQKVKKAKKDNHTENVVKSSDETVESIAPKQPKIKATNKIKKKKENKTSQESSQMSDSSATWDEILAKKNKKLLQNQLQKKKLKEEKIKMKKGKKKADSMKISTVEIKSTRPLVDVASSYSESDVDVKHAGGAQQEVNSATTEVKTNVSPSHDANGATAQEKDTPSTNTYSDVAVLKPLSSNISTASNVIQDSANSLTDMKSIADDSSDNNAKTFDDVAVRPMPLEEGSSAREEQIKPKDTQRENDSSCDKLVFNEVGDIPKDISIESHDEQITAESTTKSAPDNIVTDSSLEIVGDRVTKSTDENIVSDSITKSTTEDEATSNLLESIDKVLNETESSNIEEEETIVSTGLPELLKSNQLESNGESLSGGVQHSQDEEQVSCLDEKDKLTENGSSSDDRTATEDHDDIEKRLNEEMDSGSCEIVTNSSLSSPVKADNGIVDTGGAVEESRDVTDAIVCEDEMVCEDKQISAADGTDCKNAVTVIAKEENDPNCVANAVEAASSTGKTAEASGTAPSTHSEAQDIGEVKDVDQLADDAPGVKAEVSDAGEEEAAGASEGSNVEEEEGSGVEGEEDDEDQMGSVEDSEGDEDPEAKEETADDDEESEEEENSDIDEEDVSDQIEEDVSVSSGSNVADEEEEDDEEVEDEEQEEEEEKDEDEIENEEEDRESEADGNDVIEEEESEEDSSEIQQEVSEEEVKSTKKKQKPSKVSSRRVVNGRLSPDDSDDSEEEKERRKKKRKEKKHKKEKENRKMKRKRKHLSEEEDSESEDEEEPRKKRRRKSEKKSKKHKRKHKKHKHTKKSRRPRKHDSDEEDESEVEERRVPSKSNRSNEEHHKSKRKEKSKREKSKKRPAESDSDEEENLVVNMNDSKSYQGKKIKSRTIYMVKSNEDLRNFERRKKTKTLRTVTGKRSDR